jgi:hypothetical protein
MRLIKDLMVLFIIPSDWWLTEQLTEHKFLDIVRLSKIASSNLLNLSIGKIEARLLKRFYVT